MTQYQIEVADDLWESFKETVSRSRKLEEPIREFIEARVNLGGDQRIAVVEGQPDENNKVEIIQEIN